MSQRAPTVSIVHTSFVSVEPLTALFRELGPEVELRHVVDDGLLREVLDDGGVTDSLRRRLCAYFDAAASGADLVLSACSSVGEVVDEAAPRLRVPLLKIDAAMARDVCALGRRIGVVATLGTTLGPTTRLVEATARARGSEVHVEPVLVEGAFDGLRAGDLAGHNQRVVAAIEGLAPRVDAIACAQGSMAAIESQLGNVAVPVLTSPRLGVLDALARLRSDA